MKQEKQPLLWILWHPHQKLWNTRLINRLRKLIPVAPVHKTLRLGIIYLDSLILFLQAIMARVRMLGVMKVFDNAQVPDDVSILYLDAGTHKEANELLLVMDEVLGQISKNICAYGFEANKDSFKQVTEKIGERDNVQIINRALTHVLPDSKKIKLYTDMKTGTGDSIYRKSPHYQHVDVIRLSEFLSENKLIRDNRIVLLRMNIEGAEYDVLQDLVESRLMNCIDGYFGMWDDISKIDMKRDGNFRNFLTKHGIETFTFNGRDLRHPFRVKCIKYHMHTQIMRALVQQRPSI